MSRRDLVWQDSGACRGQNRALFYPGPGGGSDRKAKLICAQCRVRQECLDDALAHGEEFGVWGGLNADERRQIAKRKGDLK